MIFGDKSVFAIECSITKLTPHFMGYTRLWVSGIYIGSFDDLNMMYPVYSDLIRIMDVVIEEERKELERYSAIDAFKFLYDKEDYDSCMMDLGEGFEDFYIFIFRNKDEIKIVWRLRETPFFVYDNYPRTIQHSSIKTRDFCDPINEFKKFCLKSAPYWQGTEEGS